MFTPLRIVAKRGLRLTDTAMGASSRGVHHYPLSMVVVDDTDELAQAGADPNVG